MKFFINKQKIERAAEAWLQAYQHGALHKHFFELHAQLSLAGKEPEGFKTLLQDALTRFLSYDAKSFDIPKQAERQADAHRAICSQVDEVVAEKLEAAPERAKLEEKLRYFENLLFRTQYSRQTRDLKRLLSLMADDDGEKRRIVRDALRPMLSGDDAMAFKIMRRLSVEELAPKLLERIGRDFDRDTTIRLFANRYTRGNDTEKEPGFPSF